MLLGWSGLGWVGKFVCDDDGEEKYLWEQHDGVVYGIWAGTF